jgi:Tol biopolymer transport system component
MRVGGGEQSKLANGESPQVSPDESRIVYVSRYHDPSTKRLVRRLWVMRLDGSDAGALTANTDYDTIDPRWSPDGRWIVFAANPADRPGKTANYDLFLIPAEGTPTPLRLTRNEAYDSSPVFDRTGRFLYFRSNRGGHWNIWRLALALPANGPATVR